MEQEIKEELEEVYKNFKIEVEFIDFRRYKIILEIDTKKCEFEYKWNVNFTKNYNISIICYYIDKKIIQYYRKKEVISND